MEDSSQRESSFLLSLGTNIAAIPSIYPEWGFLFGLFMFWSDAGNIHTLQIVPLHAG